jgi:hypothetical protein
MDVEYMLESNGIKFRNKKKFRYGIPTYTGPFRALILPWKTDIAYQLSDSQKGLWS